MTRVLTAAVMIGALLGALALPPVVFAVAACVIVLAAWHEFATLCNRLSIGLAAAPGGLLALLVTAAFTLGPAPAVLMLAAAIPLLALATMRDHFDDPARLSAALGAALAGLAWIALPLGAQIGIRQEPDGARWLLFLYAVVAIGDSAAFYGGTRFGRHRLAPHLSPNKSVEGAVFGLVASAATGIAATAWLPGLSWLHATVLATMLAAVGQAGDLVESSLKRAAGQKDSSRLLPGHGGVLDRIDAHLLAGALLYVVLQANLLEQLPG